MSVFGKPELLEERPSDFDSLEYGREIEYVKKRIERLVEKKKHSIIAYLGPFGVGKTTVLNEVRKITPQYKWVTFEMWRYSSRNELWDGFVIQLVAVLRGRGSSELEIANEIEGKGMLRNEMIDLAILLLMIFVGSVGISGLLWMWFKIDFIIYHFMADYLKYASQSVVAIMLVLGLSKFLQPSFMNRKRSLRRVFELEDMLLKHLRIEGPIVIVVEDAERSLPDGSIFLETLNHFLKHKLPKTAQSFIVIAPQSAISFERSGTKPNNKGLESSLKIYDEKIYFNARMTESGIKNFYENLKVKREYESGMIYATQKLVGRYGDVITIRLLKHVLREMDQFLDTEGRANAIVVFTIIIARYIFVDDEKKVSDFLLGRPFDMSDELSKTFFYPLSVGMVETDEIRSAVSCKMEYFDGDNIAVNLTMVNGSQYCAIMLPRFYQSLFL